MIALDMPTGDSPPQPCHPSGMKPWILAAFVAATPITSAMAQDQAALDRAVRLGTMAALAPLCGLREEAWAFDLRRATILDATRTIDPDDAALERAPGSQHVIGAMTYAETEALEDFAQAPAPATCGPLAHDPELAHADAVVQAFRALKAGAKPST
jgi:hypothetical protein